MKKIISTILLLFAIPLFSEQLQINDWSGGMFDKYSGDVIPDKFATDIQNFYIDDDLGLIKRRGYQKDNSTTYGVSSIRNIYEYSKPTGEVFKVVICSNTIYHTSPTISNVIKSGYNTTNTTSILSWLGEVFFFNPNQSVISWDGLTLTTYDSAPQGRYAVVYGNRLIIAGVNGQGSEVYFSDINNLNFNVYYDVIYAGKGDNDIITGLYVYNGNLYIFKRKAIYVLLGTDPLSWELRLLTSEVGCVDGRSIQEFGGQLYLISLRGMERFNGQSCVRISQKNENLIDTIRQIKGNKSYSTLSTANDFAKGTYFSTQVDTYSAYGDINLPIPYSNTFNAVGDSNDNYNGIAVDSIGNPHILYVTQNGKSSGNGDVIYSSYTYSENHWTTTNLYLVIGASGTVSDGFVPAGNYCDIDLNSNNEPHIIWKTNYSDGSFFYSSFTIGKGWTKKVSVATTATNFKYSRLSVDSLGNPHYVISDTAGNVVYYSSFTPVKGWTNVTNSMWTLSDDGVGLSLDLDSNNMAYISFKDEASNKLFYSSFTYGVGWSTGSLGNMGSSDPTSIKIDSNNMPWITYSTSLNLIVSSFTPVIGWVTNTVASYSGTAMSEGLSLTFDSLNNPYIIWRYPANSTEPGLNGIIKYSFHDKNIGWITGVFDNRILPYSEMDSVFSGNMLHSIYMDGLNNLNYYQGGVGGVYISTSVNMGNSFKHWNGFDSGQLSNGSIYNYYIRSAISLSGIETATWNAINNGDLITETTPYLQYKVAMYINSISTQPTIYSLSSNWFDDYKFQDCDSVIYNDKYWLSVSTVGGTETNNTIIVMSPDESITKFQGIEASSLGIYKNNLYSGSALPNGWVYRQDVKDLYTDDGSNISAYYVTKDFNMDTSINEKYFKELWLTTNNGGGTLSMSYALDGSTVTMSSNANSTFSQTDRVTINKIPFPHATKGYNIRFKLSNNDNKPINLRRMDLFYSIEPLR